MVLQRCDFFPSPQPSPALITLHLQGFPPREEGAFMLRIKDVGNEYGYNDYS